MLQSWAGGSALHTHFDPPSPDCREAVWGTKFHHPHYCHSPYGPKYLNTTLVMFQEVNKKWRKSADPTGVLQTPLPLVSHWLEISHMATPGYCRCWEAWSLYRWPSASVAKKKTPSITCLCLFVLCYLILSRTPKVGILLSSFYRGINWV